MRTHILCILAIMLLPLGAAATASLSIEKFDIKAGETKEMVIDLTNPQDEITLVQFDLRLPSGLSIKKVDGDYDIDLARTTWKKHSLDANEQADGSIRFLLASSSNATLSGTEGVIIKVTLVANSSFDGGDIKLENILMVTPEEKELTQDPYTYSIVNSTPVPPNPGTAKLSIEEFTITLGGEAEMIVDLTNPDDEITLVQFDLRLPDGLSLKKVNGEYDIDIAGRTTWKKHSLDANAQADGTIRFLMASSSNTAIEESSGAIIKMTLVADNSFEGGTVALENILLVSPNEDETKPEKTEFVVPKPDPIPDPTKHTSTLSIEPFTITLGGEAEMFVDLTNPDDEITLVQFDLRLPDGLSLKKVDGEYDIDIAGRTTQKKHSLDANAQADGTVRFLMASSSNTAIEGSSGAIIKMTLVADNSFEGGTVALENILLVSPNEDETKPEKTEYVVQKPDPIPDPTKHTSTLSIEEFTITAGGEAEMIVDLTNPDDEITLVQFDLRLPDGLSLKKVDGEYDIDMAGRTTWKKHSLNANAQADGTIRFLMASSSNATFSGTEGAIIKMTIVADKNFDSGIVRLENILLVTPDEKEGKPDDAKIFVSGIISVMMDGDKSMPIYSISGQRLTAPRKGINIVGGKKIVIK